ncbi:MAG TPA: response regulator, partial [Armatimonadota bacterium]|nr:response regulator [Armatimonadota bacterium]
MEPRVNILLVDDHPENLTALKAVLQDFDQNLVTASSGAEALKHLLTQDFALVLLDVQMPEVDGFETARLIRERERSRHTPIVFLTAIGVAEDQIAAGYAVGAVDYLFKPLDTHILRAKVATFIELAKRTRQLEEEVRQRKQAEAEVRRLNRDLERRVRERTAALQGEVQERSRAEDAVAGLNRDLQRKVNEFQALLDVTPIGIAVARDPQCETIHANRALSQILGLPPELNVSIHVPRSGQSTGFRLVRDGKDLSPEEL